jgi:hypothetical protein
MNRMPHAMFIAALGLTAAVSAPAAESAGAPMMHSAGAGHGHPMSAPMAGVRVSTATGPALRSASVAVTTRAASAGRSPVAIRMSLPQSRMLYQFTDPKAQLQWADHYGICVGGPYDLGKDCNRSVKAVTTDGLFDTTG